MTGYARSSTPKLSFLYKPQILKFFLSLLRVNDPTRSQFSAQWKLTIGTLKKKVSFFFSFSKHFCLKKSKESQACKTTYLFELAKFEY